MTREELKTEFTGLTHDHLMVNKRETTAQSNGTTNTTATTTTTTNSTGTINNQSQDNQNSHTAQSTIAILRRHPMYDALILKKHYRACLKGYTLEFPTSNVNNKLPLNEQDCCKTKLVSVCLDGDDPIYQCQEKTGKGGLLSHEGELVYVPMNGLLARLDNYDRHGISIDSRVYAFAMGLKTAERFLTTSSMKEIQETPPL